LRGRLGRREPYCVNGLGALVTFTLLQGKRKGAEAPRELTQPKPFLGSFVWDSKLEMISSML